METLTLGIGGEGVLLAAVFVIALVAVASGLIWSRQWHLLLIAAGLIGLTGFLLNPLADSQSPLDLRAMLLGPDVLLAACVGQIVLAGAMLTVGLQVVAKPEAARWRIGLAALCCVPQPAVVMGMLLAEQLWLARQLGARPEWVGVGVSLLTLLLLAICGVSCWLVGRARLASVHLVSSLLLGVAGALWTAVPQTLPATRTEGLAQHGWGSIVPAAIAVGVCLAIGFAWQSWHQRYQVASMKFEKS